MAHFDGFKCPIVKQVAKNIQYDLKKRNHLNNGMERPRKQGKLPVYSLLRSKENLLCTFKIFHSLLSDISQWAPLSITLFSTQPVTDILAFLLIYLHMGSW